MENLQHPKELGIEFIDSVRANHALEHATLHVLEEKGLKAALFGLSDAGGFWVAGHVTDEMLLEAAHEALARLQGGEVKLAVHENCGTNLAATGAIVGGLAWLGMLGVRRGFARKLERLPLVVLMATIGLVIAQPLGPLLQQKFTTLASGRRREILGLQRYGIGQWIVLRVSTRAVEG